MAVINMLPSGGTLSAKGVFVKEEHYATSNTYSFTTSATYKKAFVIASNGTTPTLSTFVVTPSVSPDFEVRKVYSANYGYQYMYYEELPQGTTFSLNQNRGFTMINIFSVKE